MRFVELSTIANIATALAVLTAVVFGLFEMRRARQEREERAAFSAIQAIMTPAWMKSAALVLAIPEGTSAAQIANDPNLRAAAESIAIILEGIGYSVFLRIVPISVVDDFVGGATRVAWKKLRPFIELERARQGTEKSWEWFQWLAEQLERHGTSRTSLTVGAAVAYKDWKP
jgi:hypothetical protein